jgi:hypothetical protein
MIFLFRQIAVPVCPLKIKYPLSIAGKNIAPKSSSKQNYAKDMHILTGIFPPISFYSKVLT